MTGGGIKGKRKKKDKWQEAAEEFYQESYPAGQGQASSTVDLTAEAGPTTRKAPARRNFPLPSHTARRNSLAPTSRRGYFTRKQSYNTGTLNNGNNFMTLASTMGRTASEDVTVSLMPDMADETIPDEKVIYEAVQKLKILPEPMHQKRMRKSKLGAIPQRRLGGWSRIRWNIKKIFSGASHVCPSFTFWSGSLEEIEMRCGTAIANVFLLIRWVLKLNLLISLLVLGAVVAPYFLWYSGFAFGHQTRPDFNCPVKEPLQNASWGPNDFLDCCAALHTKQATDNDEHSITTLLLLMTNQTQEAKLLEFSPLFYGFYNHPLQDKGQPDLFPVLYVSVIVVVLSLSLLFMVQSVGIAIKEMIMTLEGDSSSYTNIAFTGWDHYTKDAKSAQFKRSVIRHEIQTVLRHGKHKLATVLRRRNDQIILVIVRIVLNVIVLLLIAGAGAAIYSIYSYSVQAKREAREQNSSETPTTMRDVFANIAVGFLPAILITSFNLVFPTVLTKIGKLERLSMQMTNTILLLRILFIRLLCVGFAGASLYVFEYCDIAETKDVKEKQCTLCTKRGSNGTNADKPIYRDECWENAFADQFYKLLFVDFLIKFVLCFLVEPLRSRFKACFKNTMCQTIGTLRFDIVRNSIDILYLQTLVWIGMYFAPFISMFASLYIFLVFYIKRFSLFHNCNTVPDTYKAIRTRGLFAGAKVLSLLVASFANVFIVGYTLSSKGCGPFRVYNNAWESVTEFVKTDTNIENVYNYISSPGISFPIALVLLIMGYYYYGVAKANRGMVETLRHLLILEGHDKQYLFARLNSLRRETHGSERSRSRTRDSKNEHSRART